MRTFFAILLLTMTSLADSTVNRPWIQIAMWQPDATIRVEFANVQPFTDVLEIQRFNAGMNDEKIKVNPSTLPRTQMNGQAEVIIWTDTNVFSGAIYSYRMRLITGTAKGPWSLEVQAIQSTDQNNEISSNAARHSILPSRGVRGTAQGYGPGH